MQDGAIVVRPAVRRYTLEELIAGPAPKGRRRETDWGEPVGEEVW